MKTEKSDHSIQTKYQLIDGVAITPKLLERVKMVQEDGGENLPIWESCTMRLLNAFVFCSDGNMDDAERLDHIDTICNLLEFVICMKAPREVELQQIEERKKHFNSSLVEGGKSC